MDNEKKNKKDHVILSKIYRSIVKETCFDHDVEKQSCFDHDVEKQSCFDHDVEKQS